MQYKHLLAFAVAAAGLISSALAQTKVYIAGAPAIRQPLTTAIEALVDAGGGTVTRSYNGSNIITANVVSWTGATVAGKSVTIKLTYNGSAGGYQSTGGSLPVRFIPDGAPAGTTTDVLTDLNAPAETAIPDFHIANEFQASTPWIGQNDLAYNQNINYEGLIDDRTGILPLRLVASPAAPAGLNLTPQLARQLYENGSLRLSQLTGLDADKDKTVYALSRGIDSGIRTLWSTNNGVGTATEILTYQATFSLGGGKPVVGLVLTSGGTGYNDDPLDPTDNTPVTVTFSGGGGGTGAAATATVDPTTGKITGLTLTSNGSGYTSAPNVVIAGSNGKLAAATAVIGGGTVTNQVPYPAGTVIGVNYAVGNGGYPTFGPLLSAITATLNLPSGNAGDIYITPLSDADAQVALAGGAKEVAWNGNYLGTLGTYGNTNGAYTGTNVGTASPALAHGKYDLWGFVRLAYRPSLAGDKLAVEQAIATRLRTVEGPVLIKDINVTRYAPDGGPLYPLAPGTTGP